VTDQSADSTYSVGVRPPVAEDRYRATHKVSRKSPCGQGRVACWGGSV
jgi:hypothetical protein